MTVDKILIIRTDRLGDVMLTTPYRQLFAKRGHRQKIYWLVRAYAAPLLEHNPTVDGVLIDSGGSSSELAAKLAAEKFDVAIVAYPRWRTAYAVWRAGIPTRIGPANKWYALLFTRRLWQHRSKGEKHESDYNLELLAPMGVSGSRYATTFVLTDGGTQTGSCAIGRISNFCREAARHFASWLGGFFSALAASSLHRVG